MNTRRKDFDGPFHDRPFLKRNQYWSREFVVSYLGKIDWLFRGYIYIIAQRSKDRENLRKWIIFFSSTKTIASRNRNFWSLKFRNDRIHDKKFFFVYYCSKIKGSKEFKGKKVNNFFSSPKTIASRNRRVKFRNDRTHDEKFFFVYYCDYIIAQRSKDRENLRGRKWIIFSSPKTIASRNRNFWSLKSRNDRTHDEKFFFDTYLLICFRPIIRADV